MKKPLRIAIYSGEIPSTTFIERLIDGVSKSNVEVLLFGNIKHNVKYDGKVKTYGYYNNKISKLWSLIKYSCLLFFFKPKDKKRLDYFLREHHKQGLASKAKFYPVLWHKPDVFHVQWAKGIKDWIWVRDFGMKLVLSLRGAHINYSPIADLELAKMYKNYFPQVDGFHAVSHAIAKETAKYGAALDKIKVVYSGLPKLESSSYIQSKSKQAALETSADNELQILSVGRSHWKKGYTYAIDACKLLKQAGFKFKYTIIGATNDMELLYQVKDLELQNEVCLLDKQTFSAVKDYMLHADVLLLPSVEEGIANVVLEAMALGTLVLSTTCGGMDEVIVDTKNGFLVPIRDSKAIANAINTIATLTLEQKGEIIERAKKKILAQHNEDSMTSGMIDLYHQVLN